MSRATAASAGRPRISCRSSITTTIGRPSTASKPWMASSMVSHPATSEIERPRPAVVEMGDEPLDRAVERVRAEPDRGGIRDRSELGEGSGLAGAGRCDDERRGGPRGCGPAGCRCARVGERARVEPAFWRRSRFRAMPLSPPRSAPPNAPSGRKRTNGRDGAAPKITPAGVGAAPLQRWLSARSGGGRMVGPTPRHQETPT